MALLTATLRSIWAQTNGNHRTIIVCHERPNIEIDLDDRFESLIVDFPLHHDSTGQRMFDKLRKVQRGLLRARDINAEFVMPCDADDLVSRHLVELMFSEMPQFGACIHRGFGYDAKSGRLFRINEFHRACATCNIFRRSSEVFPTSMSREEEARCWPLRPHAEVDEAMQAMGQPLNPVAARAAIYMVGHGGNDGSIFTSGYSSSRVRMLLRALRHYYPVTRRIREDFGIGRTVGLTHEESA